VTLYLVTTMFVGQVDNLARHLPDLQAGFGAVLRLRGLLGAEREPVVVGIDGSAYFIGGFGVTALAADEMVVVPIRTGVGARLGVNMGYLKFTPEATWNPF